MTCYLCNGEYKASTTTHFVDLKKCMVIVKKVPCWECEQCGAIVYDDPVVARLDDIIKQVAGMMTELAVVEYTDTQAA